MNVGQTVQAGDGVGEVVQVHAEGRAILLKCSRSQRTRWYFPHELAPIERSVALAPERFPTPLQTFSVQPSDTSNENLVVFLHGLGDTHAASFALGQAMALPQTALLSLRAPHALPFDLGYSWYHALSDQGDVLPTGVAHAARDQSMAELLPVLHEALRVLHTVYGWPYNRVFLFGLAQGAHVALSVATTFSERLGGVVSLSGGLLSPPSPAFKQPTPVLLLHSKNDPLVSSSVFAACQAGCNSALGRVETHVFDVPGPLSLATRDELHPVMAFFAEALYLRHLALEQQADIFEVK
ncbi:hypothetical protein SPRG_09587 [Saprolegnia parasitica CBS 223.65]|uniref:Phospholipase/carboxylesterase/thioesterase domain-containing protein n=1 Tax=Saprolegnia parasitica (strain CBS 223.65) TaxID=695850 RepID=A0A067C330_SAPPC|nr:hypothetical protein SPRG_09587 [Saprolegnia parasitica CBS 223.65]KDO24943.1 hypothetical protein SPRG_09587 [Saprolegnia parasitica CBS 223.65]|eukprot:XP_012204403.1 hypothetical protein SPRG_09587 [Saprolegnia parasitica CBS 223.65]